MFLFGKFDDYSYQRRDLSPSEGYMFEKMLVEMKNRVILPLFINFALFWAQPFGYLNHDFWRLRPDEEHERKMSRIVESMYGQYELEPKDWLEILAWVIVPPTEEGYNDFRLTEEEQERNRWLMIKGIGLPEWHQWFIKICESNSEPEALKVKVVGYDKGEECIGMGWAYANLENSSWLDSIAMTTFDEEEFERVARSRRNQIEDLFKKLYPDEKDISKRSSIENAFFHTSRLVKSFENESRLKDVLWHLDFRLEHRVLFMNKDDAELIRSIIEPRYLDRIVWIGELLDKVIVDPERKRLAEAKWNQIRDFLLERESPFEPISDESVMPLHMFGRYYKPTFERFIARNITDENPIESQEFISKAEDALSSAWKDYLSNMYYSCEQKCYSALKYILKASATKDDVAQEENLESETLLDLIYKNGKLFKEAKGWSYESCKELKDKVSFILGERNLPNDASEAKKHAKYRLDVVNKVMEKYSQTYS